MSGQRIIFRKTAGNTGGELLEVESICTKATPSRPPVHYHPNQEERFEVLACGLDVLVEGKERTLEEGEVLTILPGTPHEMWSERAGTRVNWQTRPALNTEEFFETIWGLARDAKTNEKGVPNLLQVAVIARGCADEFRLASPPLYVQRALFAVLAPIGRLLGYRARYPEYNEWLFTIGPGWMRVEKARRNTDLEWFCSAVLAATGITIFGHFEEKTSRWRRLSKWAFCFGGTALLSRGPGRLWTFVWVLGLPCVGLGFHLWWCRSHGIDPLTAEPKERYYELRGWGGP